jgi:hypothetical protein
VNAETIGTMIGNDTTIVTIIIVLTVRSTKKLMSDTSSSHIPKLLDVAPSRHETELVQRR